jgi:hypothetical protein
MIIHLSERQNQFLVPGNLSNSNRTCLREKKNRKRNEMKKEITRKFYSMQEHWHYFNATTKINLVHLVVQLCLHFVKVMRLTTVR